MYQITNVVPLTDGREVLTSFGIPVAAFIPTCGGYITRDDLPSMTQTMCRHVRRWTGGQSESVDLATFRALVAPVEVR